jgi:hypothetical protein
MRYLRILTVLGICLVTASYAHAQRVVVGVGIGAPVVAGPAYVGPAPVCAYGYYSYAPYACAPAGFYGPSWFVGGVFIGAGPWYHGPYVHPVFGRPGWGPGPRPFVRGPAYVGHGPVGGGYHGAVAFRGGGRR